MKTVEIIPAPVIFELGHLVHVHGHMWREPILRNRLSRAHEPELTAFCKAFGTGWVAQVTEQEIVQEVGRRVVLNAQGA